MPTELEQTSLQEQFEEIIANEDKLKIQEFLNQQNISDVAELIYENGAHESQIVANLSIHRAASVFKILELPTQKRIIKNLPAFKTAELLNELPADDRTSFFEELPGNVVRELLKTLHPDELKITLSLLGYPENSVGRLMTPDYIYVFEYDTVEDVLNTIRKYAKNSETIDVIYVINEKGELLDDIRIREFILASPDKMVNEMMDNRFIALKVEDDQELASEAFKMNNRVALPVVSKTNKLLGIVTIDDVLWVAEEEYSEDIQKIGGTEALNLPYLEMGTFNLFKKRVGWLIILFIGELLTASAMGFFESEIQKFVVLALFIPLIISSGGNTGSQASTLIIQAMAVGELTVLDWWRVIKREILQGLMLGACLGVLGFLRVFIWNKFMPGVYGPNEIRVALTVGISLLGVVLWGTLVGSIFPIALKRAGADPAVSSAPFVATMVDVTGLIIYFSVAYLLLKGILL
jgi:magnesium transporter